MRFLLTIWARVHEKQRFPTKFRNKHLNVNIYNKRIILKLLF